MDWVVISGVADTAAAFGVIGSLIFVGFQVRQNSAGLRHTAVQAQMSVYQDLFSNILDSGEMAEIWFQGLQRPEAVDGSRRTRYFVMGGKMLRTFQGMHWQWERGVLDDGLFRSMTALIADLAVAPGWQHLWQERRHQFDASFQKFMDAMHAESKGVALSPEFAHEEG
jgi:hypothetical protein